MYAKNGVKILFKMFIVMFYKILYDVINIWQKLVVSKQYLGDKYLTKFVCYVNKYEKA